METKASIALVLGLGAIFKSSQKSTLSKIP